LRLASNRALMGVRANGRVYNLIAWLTVVVVSALSLFLVGKLIFLREP
jgi:Mn2+/Fe2+ NRAMP family transporter